MLCWANPLKSDIAGLKADTKVSPNGIELILEKDGNKREFTLQDGTSYYVLDNTFASGNYYISLRNIGNESNGGVYKFTNGHLSSSSATKLEALENLNIQDGINLSWTDPNKYSTKINKVLINITQYIGTQQLNFSGVVAVTETAVKTTENDDATDSVENITKKSVKFENIRYYEDNYSNKILVLIDSCEKDEDGNLTYNGKQVKTFSSEGYFRVNVVAYGDNLFVNSDESNSIEITRPDPVTNLEIVNGKITWKGSDSANGYILTITRKDLSQVDDTEFNLNNETIYVQGNEYYNLTDVNYYYTVSVKAYSLVTTEDDQTIASDKCTVENYLFNTFSAGNGTNENPYIITGEDELINVKYNNFATYSIKNNITFTKYVSPLFDSSYPFVGKIKGNNYKIENLQISDSTIYGGLLGYVSSQEITDVRVIDGEKITTTTKYSAKIDGIQFTQAKIASGCYVGIIAGYSSGEISNITISSSQISSSSEILTDVGASMRDIYSGTIVGENYGKIEKCSVESTTINPTEKPKRYSGGICAKNYGTILACKTSATVYGNVSGGVCATNYGTINFVKFSGSTICENYISSTDDLLGAGGGVCAYNEEEGVISNCLIRCDLSSLSKGVIDASQSTNAKTVYAGGLVGDNKGLCYNNCIEINLFRRNNAISCVLGKIFGYNYNNEVFNNYVLYSENTQATVLCEGAIITGTNKEITEYTTEIQEELNKTNTEKGEETYSWSITLSSDLETGTIDFEI